LKQLLPQFLLVAVLVFSSRNRLQAAESLELDANQNVFFVLAAINAAGYDEGVNLPDNSELRKQMRDFMAKQNPEVLPELRRFYQQHLRRNATQDLSQYISYALSVTGPPDFKWRTRDVEVPPDAAALSDFTPLLIDFYQQAHLAQVWQQVQPFYQKEMVRYQPLLIRMTSQVQGYLRVPQDGYLGRRFHVYLDLLATPEQVQTRNYGDDAFVIVTAAAQPPLYDIRHAYLHFEIDPVVIKYGVDLAQKRSLIDFVLNAPLEQMFKDDFVLLSNECVIKAVEARLDKSPAEVQQAARQGFVLAPFFSEQLREFEQQPQGFRFYLEDMVKAIDLNRESARIQQITFDKTAAQREAKIITSGTPPAELSAAGRTVEQAEDLYANRNLDGARELYLKALEQQGGAADHAQAWYGLARISVLQNQPEAAVKLFQKTLDASPDDQTKAWSLVYMARLARAAGEAVEATKYYRSALDVPGASEKAREAAQTESKNIANSQETPK
jgi:tetratricopeptide (TPR) repeat protein